MPDAIELKVVVAEAHTLADGKLTEVEASDKLEDLVNRYDRALKLEKMRAQTGALACEVCQFDFEARYGELGKDYAECHHTIPVSEMPPGASTKLQDVVLVCSNCHLMIHRKRPWLRVDAIRNLLRFV